MMIIIVIVIIIIIIIGSRSNIILAIWKDYL